MALDLDRVLRDMDRREMRLGKALAARAALDAGAEAQLAGVISERVDASLGGFEHRLTQQLARLPSEVAMQDILARLEQNVQALAKLPPPRRWSIPTVSQRSLRPSWPVLCWR
jgi:hypothetical protein